MPKDEIILVGGRTYSTDEFPQEAFVLLRVIDIAHDGAYVRFETENGLKLWAETPPPDPFKEFRDLARTGNRSTVWVVFRSNKARILRENEAPITPQLQPDGCQRLSSHVFRGRVLRTIPEKSGRDGRTWLQTVILESPGFHLYAQFSLDEETRINEGSFVEAEGHILAAPATIRNRMRPME